MYSSHQWQDVVKITGVKIPPHMNQLARLIIQRGKASPVVDRVILYEVTSMEFIVHGMVWYGMVCVQGQV